MATYYWVGGAGTWDNTNTHWSLSSGGAGGAGVPTAADNVVFDSASNATTYTVTLASSCAFTASYSTITSMTTVLTVTAVTSGSLAVGDTILFSGSVLQITSFGTGTGGTGTYNCNVLCGVNGTAFSASAMNVSYAKCFDISMSGPATGTINWSYASGLSVVTSGSPTVTSSITSPPTFVLLGSASHTLGINGTNGNAVYLAGSGTYTLSGTLNTSTLNHGQGTFTTNNNTVTASAGWSLNSTGTKTVNLGSSVVNVGGGSYPLDGTLAAASTLTLNAGTSQLNINGNSAFYVSFLGKTWYNVSITSTAIGSVSVGFTIGGYATDTPTFNNLSFAGQTSTGTNVGYAPIYFTSPTVTVNGTLTIGAGTNATCRLFFQSKTFGTAKTISVNSFDAGSADVDWRDITITGAAGTISGTRFGNCGGNTGISFDAPKTVYWSLSSGFSNWNNSIGWATASGGTPAINNFPLAQDTAIFDNSSGSTVFVSMNANYNMPTLNCSSRTTAMTLTASNSGPGYFHGSVTLSSSVTISFGGFGFTFANRGTTAVFTTNGATFISAISITVNCISGTLQLAQNTSTGSTGTTLNYGTLDLNNYTLTCSIFSSSNSNARTLAFGTGVINIIGNNTTVVSMFTTTNLTITGTPVFNLTYSGATGVRVVQSLQGAGSNYISINITAGTDSVNISSNLTDVNTTGFTGTLIIAGSTIYGNLLISSGVTSINAGTVALNFKSTSGTKTITTNGKTLDFPVTFDGVGGTWQLQDNLTVGSTRTTTLTNGTLNLNSKTLTTGLFSSTNSNARTIAFGTGNITTKSTGSVWDTGTTTNLSVTGTPVVNIDNNTATSTFVATGSLSESNSISFNFINGTYALFFLNTAGNTAKNVDFTGFAGTLGTTSTATIYGNLTISSGMTLNTLSGNMTFGGTSGTKTITTNGKTLDFPITFNGSGSAWQLQDNLTTGSTRTTTLTNGTLDLNGKTYIAGTSFATAAGTKNITFNGGTLVCAGGATNSFNNAVPTGFTTTAGTGTGKISMAGATAKTFVGGGSTYNCILSQDGAGALTISGSNSFNDIQASSLPSTITFTSSTTQTVSNFTASGTAGNLLTINSSTPGTRATLSKSSGTVNVSYMSIKDSNATGGATWQALETNGNVNNGNNLGWIFNFVAIVTGFFMFFDT